MALPDADWALTRDPMLAHIRAIVEASDVPVNADFESGYADEPAELAETVRLCVETGVSSPEDFIAGVRDLEEAIRRLKAYAAAGADCLYAPGIQTREQIASVVTAFAPKPVNLMIGGAIGLTAKDAADLGVRRISAGGACACCLGWVYPRSAGPRRGQARWLCGCGIRGRPQPRIYPGCAETEIVSNMAINKVNEKAPWLSGISSRRIR